VKSKKTGEPKNKLNLLFIFLLIAISFAVYFNSLGNGFVFDDQLLIDDQAYILRDFKNVFSSASSFVFQDKTSAGFYRPILVLSYFIDYHLGGGAPFSFHLTNILIHFISIILVAYAAFMIFGEAFPALLAGSIFALHPAQSEAVAWISGRNDPLLTVFILLSFIFFAKYRENNSRILLVVSIMTFLLALFTKESALIFPVVLLGYDYFNIKINSHTKEFGVGINQKRSPKYEYFLPYLLLAALIILYAVIRIFMIKGLGGGIHPGIDGLRVIPLTYLFYFKTLIYPAGFSVVPFIKTQLGGFEYLIRCLPLLFLAGLIFWLWGRIPVVAFGLWWGLLALLPVSGIIPAPIMVMEHRLYSALFGFSLVFAWIGNSLLKQNVKLKSVIILILGVIFFLLGGMTFQRNRLFADPMLLWETSARNNPNSDVIQVNLATAYIEAKKYLSAEEHLKKALELRPANEIAHYNLGYLYLLSGREKLGKKEFEKAVELDPKYIKAHYNLGIIALNDRRYREAIRRMGLILQLKPNFVLAYITLGDAYYNLKEDIKAKECYTRGLEIDPMNLHAQEMLKKLNIE